MHTICICRSQLQLWWQHFISFPSPDSLCNRHGDVRLLQHCGAVKSKGKVDYRWGYSSATVPRRLNSMVKILFYTVKEQKITLCKARFPDTFNADLQQTWNVSRKLAVSWFFCYQKKNANSIFCLQTRTMQSINLLRKLLTSIRSREECWCVKWNYWE